jgi:hypothetical protein
MLVYAYCFALHQVCAAFSWFSCRKCKHNDSSALCRNSTFHLQSSRAAIHKAPQMEEPKPIIETQTNFVEETGFHGECSAIESGLPSEEAIHELNTLANPSTDGTPTVRDAPTEIASPKEGDSVVGALFTDLLNAASFANLFSGDQLSVLIEAKKAFPDQAPPRLLIDNSSVPNAKTFLRTQWPQLHVVQLAGVEYLVRHNAPDAVSGMSTRLHKEDGDSDLDFVSVDDSPIFLRVAKVLPKCRVLVSRENVSDWLLDARSYWASTGLFRGTTRQLSELCASIFWMGKGRGQLPWDSAHTFFQTAPPLTPADFPCYPRLTLAPTDVAGVKRPATADVRRPPPASSKRKRIQVTYVPVKPNSSLHFSNSIAVPRPLARPPPLEGPPIVRRMPQIPPLGPMMHSMQMHMPMPMGMMQMSNFHAAMSMGMHPHHLGMQMYTGYY